MIGNGHPTEVVESESERKLQRNCTLRYTVTYNGMQIGFHKLFL